MGLALVRGFRQFKIPGAPDLIERGLLNDKAAVDQGLEIDEPHIDVIPKPVYPGYLDNSQVGPLFEDCERPFLIIGRGNHFQVVFGNKFSRGLVDLPVDHQASAEGGDAVCTVRTVVCFGKVCPKGRAAGIVVLQDHSRRLFHQILQYIQAIIKVGQVDFPGMLAFLKHIFFTDGADQAILGIDEPAAPQR